MTEKPHDGGLSRRWVLAACDDSLARLAVDYIDIYYLHRDDPDTPLAETVGALGDLIRAGKIRYFGVSNYRGWRIAEVVSECEAQGVPMPVVCQPYYNLLNRMPEVEILPACDHYGIGVASYSPIARGVLTGKYIPGAPMPEGSRAARGDARMLETELREESYVIAQKLREHAGKTGRTLTQFALAWLWANRIVTSVHRRPAHARAVAGLRRRRSARRGATRTRRSSIRWWRPGIRRRRATPIRSIRSSGGCSTSSSLKNAAGSFPAFFQTPRSQQRVSSVRQGSERITAYSAGLRLGAAISGHRESQRSS